MRGRRYAWALPAALLSVLAWTAQSEAANTLSPQQWHEDLQVLANGIVKFHPEAFHKISEPDFRNAVAILDKKLPDLSDHEVEAELIRLVAMLGEGHSRISLPGLPDPMSDVPDITPIKDPRLAFHSLPIRLALFSDGLFVTAATPDYASLVGDQVLRIGDRSSSDVLTALSPFINRDNDSGAQMLAPVFATIPELLAATHTIGDERHVALALKSPTGTEINVTLPPLNTGVLPTSAASTTTIPLYLQHPERNLWADYEGDTRTLFIKIHVLEDSADTSVNGFASDLTAMANTHAPARVVIDSRGCHGGDNQKFRALLLAIVRNENLNRLGRLFVITDRETFSAAVNAVTDLERLANVIFVGEAPSGSPNSWGDPKRLALPNSGLVARISTIYWRDWTTGPNRSTLSPDISTPLSSRDYFAGHDPAMDAVTQFPEDADFAGILEYLSRAGARMGTVLRLYYQHKTDPLWAKESTRHAMQVLGADLLARKAYQDALLAFEINAHDYPDSLTDAIDSVRAAQASAPHNAELDRLASTLDSMRSGK